MRTSGAWLALILGLPLAAGAQEQAQCIATPRDTLSSPVLSLRLPSGNRNVFMGAGTYRCPARGITLVADSVESYGDEGRIFMLGNVRYTEPRLRVTADYITYFTADERVVASGNVVATLPTGSTLRGPQAEYRRAVPRVRAEAELHSMGRPTVTIVQQQGAGRTAGAARSEPPTTVTANTLFMRGDSLLYASGRVDIARPDFGASGDSVFMNTATHYMRLMRGPAIEGRTGRPFRLTGDLIDVFSRDRQLDRVLSQGNARAVSEDMTLTSDTLEFRIASELLQAANAWGSRTRPEALSPTQRITADSIVVDMPGQRVRRMTAVGTAYAEAEPDTIRFRTPDKDWLRGDTIHAWFDTVAVAAGDSAPAQMRELLALGDGRAYNHFPPSDTSERRPAISYVRGDSIVVTFDSGRVRAVRVRGEITAPGFYAEPTGNLPAVPTTPGQGPPGTPPPAGAAPRAQPSRP